MTPYEQIEEARVALCLKKFEAAEYLGFTGQHYSRWRSEQDKVPMACVIALRAAAGLDYPPPPKATFKGNQQGAEKVLPERNPVEPDDRAFRMRDLYVAGLTLKEIGDQYGITRERVRQILTRHFGFSGKDGGQAFRALRKKKKLERRRDEEAMRKYGCTWAQYKTVRQIGRDMRANGESYYKTPLGAFSTQKRSAAWRGIDWQMTFWQWWTVWQKSGKWAKRGLSGYVMCRKGDKGPYHPDNVYIATSGQNIYDALNKSGLPLGVAETNSGRFTAHRMIGGKDIYLGIFDTPEEAHLAFLKAPHISANTKAA